MTKAEILDMAKEAGLTDKDLGDWMIEYGNAEGEIKKFAALVAEKAAAKEREACAQVAESYIDTAWPFCDVSQQAKDTASEIRARNNHD